MRTNIIFTIFFISTLNVFSQSANDKAKAYYLEAVSSFEARNYSKSLQRLNATEEVLGSTNARIISLKVKVYYALKDYQNAKQSLDLFSIYSGSASESLKNEVLSYIIKVEDGLKAEATRKENAIKRKEDARLAEIKRKEDARLAEIKRKEDILTFKDRSVKGAIYFDSNGKETTKSKAKYYRITKKNINNQYYIQEYSNSTGKRMFQFEGSLNSLALNFTSNTDFFAHISVDPSITGKGIWYFNSGNIKSIKSFYNGQLKINIRASLSDDGLVSLLFYRQNGNLIRVPYLNTSPTTKSNILGRLKDVIYYNNGIIKYLEWYYGKKNKKQKLFSRFNFDTQGNLISHDFVFIKNGKISSTRTY